MSIKVYGAKAFTDVLKGIIRDLRVTWMLEELGVPYEHIVLDPTQGETKTPEYLKLNPMGKVPTLVDDDFVLFESAAICEYLAEKYGKFVPAVGTAENYLCKQWCFFAVSNIEPHVGRIFSADYFLEKNDVTAGIKQIAMETLPRFLIPLNQHLVGQDYMIKSGFSVADILLMTCLTYIKHTPIIGDFPNLQNYYNRCSVRPAFQKASAKNGI